MQSSGKASPGSKPARLCGQAAPAERTKAISLGVHMARVGEGTTQMAHFSLTANDN